MTSRPPCWCPKQRKGGHVGAPTKSSGNLTLLCKRFLLFSLKNMTVDHVSENQQLVFFLSHFTLFQTVFFFKERMCRFLGGASENELSFFVYPINIT